MKKLTLTVLHKLPNRVRFKISHEIIDIKKFFETIKVGAKSTALRYNRTINTLLITFEPEEITIDEMIYRTATALSVEHDMTSVKLVEDFEEKSIDSLSVYSGAAILLSFLYGLGKSKIEKLQLDIIILQQDLQQRQLWNMPTWKRGEKVFLTLKYYPLCIY